MLRSSVVTDKLLEKGKVVFSVWGVAPVGDPCLYA